MKVVIDGEVIPSEDSETGFIRVHVEGTESSGWIVQQYLSIIKELKEETDANNG